MKTIGIIGAGNIGKIVAAHLLKNNIPVMISNSRGRDAERNYCSIGKGGGGGYYG